MASDRETDVRAGGVGRRALLGSAVGLASLMVGPVAARVTARGGRYTQVDSSPTRSTRELLSYPDDPFMVTQNGYPLLLPTEQQFNGWPSLGFSEGIRTLLRFHPDVLDFAILGGFEGGSTAVYNLHELELDAIEVTGLPGTAGWNPSLDLGDDAMSKYGPIMEERGWRYPDGTPLEHPRGLLVRTFEGRPSTITFGETFGNPSPFAPGTLDLLVTAVTERFEQGFSGFYLDGVNTPFLMGLDYSVWAVSAFREHLAALPPDRREALGVDDPASFDIKQYLRDRDLTPSSDADPREDAVFREFLLFQHRGLRDFFASFRRRVLDGLPEGVAPEDIAIWANQIGSLDTPQAPTIYASDAFDLINAEQTTPFFDHGYKIMHALGRYEKPVLAEAELTDPPDGGEGPLGAFDPERDYPQLQRFMLAEGTAMGAVHRIPATGRLPPDLVLNHWVREDGTVPAELQTFVDFVWAHRRFLADVTFDNPVAVVWSLPTHLWRRYGRGLEFDLGYNAFNGGRTVSSFLGTTRLLREAQVPYDVLVFGQPDLWNDQDQLARLGRYDAIVLPSVLCLTDAQLEALEAYLADGGSVLSSGEPPARDERYEPRDDVAGLFDHARAIVLEGDPGHRRHDSGERDGSLSRSVEDAGVTSMTVADDPTIGVNRLMQPEASRLVVHVLNYDYAPSSDTFSEKRDVELRITAPDFEVSSAQWYAPQVTHDLSLTDRGDALEVVVPELVEWGFVVFAPGDESLEPPVSKQQAREAVADAERALERARETVDEDTPRLVVAEERYRAAEVAIEHRAFGQASVAAEEVVEVTSDIRPPGRDRSTAAETPGFSVVTAAVSGLFLAVLARLLGREDDPPG